MFEQTFKNMDDVLWKEAGKRAHEWLQSALVGRVSRAPKTPAPHPENRRRGTVPPCPPGADWPGWWMANQPGVTCTEGAARRGQYRPMLGW